MKVLSSALIAASLLVMGCGDDDDSGGGEGPVAADLPPTASEVR